ncbi:MAG: UDP-2,3-diacylglucosamine diphosphatase [Deltaproteobacteria bacterium]
MLVSDIHLGSDLNRSGDLLRILADATFERLIILGDLFDDERLDKLNSDDWRFIKFIRILSADREVIWVEGNHDEGVFKVMPNLLGVRAEEQFAWHEDGKKFLAIHGHQFDHYHQTESFASKIASRIFRNLLRLENRIGGNYINKFSHRNKLWIRLAEQVAQRATEYGRELNADYVFCGHTHKASRRSSGGVVYINTGCWHDRVCHFAVVQNSEVTLNSYE